MIDKICRFTVDGYHNRDTVSMCGFRNLLSVLKKRAFSLRSCQKIFFRSRASSAIVYLEDVGLSMKSLHCQEEAKENCNRSS